MSATIAPGSIAYIAVDQYKAKVVKKEAAAKGRKKGKAWRNAALLWGDSVYVRKITGSMAEVSAKGHRLKIPVNKLTTTGILSLWQIDVGQGDATLMRFPDDTWGMVDVGPARSGFINTNSARTSEDFLKWIAFQDNNWRFEGAAKDDTFHLDWLVITHPDEDHFGAGREMMKNLGKYWSIGTVYHNGMGRFSGEAISEYEPATDEYERLPGFSQLGTIDGPSDDQLFVTSLIDHFGDVGRLLEAARNRSWTLSRTNYAKFLKGLYEHREGAVGKLKRLSDRSDGSALGSGGVTVKVLGPIEESMNGRPALRYLDNNSADKRTYYSLHGPSLTRNGQSVVLRFDFGDVHILLTGDLNFKSQALLQQRWEPDEFSCHVAKACHHGSEDISWRFLRAMSPVATMFSSGDQETHVHPRALILGLSGALSPMMKVRTKGSPSSGPKQKFRTQRFEGFSEEQVFAPLLYSTELSRSVRLRSDMRPYQRSKTEAGEWHYEKVGNPYLKGNKADDDFVPFSNVRVVDQLTYGLVNVRTDGHRVLMAVLEEGKPERPEFHVESFVPSDFVRMED